MRKAAKQTVELTTPQRLAATIKSARNIMRKDKGLNGDLDRLPMLTWLMFLKFIEDTEEDRKTMVELQNKRYKPLLEYPYRWSDWAAPKDGLTGEDLLAFVNQERAKGPDGKEGEGLFHYLRSLQGTETHDTRDVIRTVFEGVVNRMISGYLLRDVINKINEIHFNSTEELHTLGMLYESMLREMRDAAGDSGEFYTPRPVVEMMVKAVNPQLGETILDPACGTGGFLAAAFEHLRPQCKKAQDYKTLQRQSLYGQEAKPLPFLLAQMNLVLHGLEAPDIRTGNSLAVNLRDIGETERVDVILTNPPFGGEEEDSIKKGFPPDQQTKETALLFLQLIMRKLRKVGGKGRAAVVVPNGVLFGDGVAAKIKADLIKDFNLHTIVRLPSGVFEPYTPIPTNILFFDRSTSTETVWFYELAAPAGKRKYTKTSPLRAEEFIPLLAWWDDRAENSRAWKVGVEELRERDFNLDVRNPNAEIDTDLRDPAVIVAQVLLHEAEALSLLNDLAADYSHLKLETAAVVA